MNEVNISLQLWAFYVPQCKVYSMCMLACKKNKTAENVLIMPPLLLLVSHSKLHSSTRVSDNLQPGGSTEWNEHAVSGSTGEPCHHHLYCGRGRLSVFGRPNI